MRILNKLFLGLFFTYTAFAGFPPTTSKGSADSTDLTTFNFRFPNFTMTHSGVVGSLGVNSIAGGGTGAATKAAGFDALSPLTTSGDILYGGAAGTGTRLAKGTDGQVLTLASGIPSWSGAPSLTLTNTHLFVGNGSNVAADVAASGDLSLANTGAFTIGNNAVTTAKIINSAITNAKLANMTGPTFKGRDSGTGAPQDLSPASVAGLLPVFTADTGISLGVQGLVPGPGLGDAAANYVLHANTSFTPAVTFGDITSGSSGAVIPWIDASGIISQDTSFYFDGPQSTLQVTKIGTSAIQNPSNFILWDLTTDKLMGLGGDVAIGLADRQLVDALGNALFDWNNTAFPSSAPYYFNGSSQLVGDGGALTNITATSFLGLTSGTSGGIPYFNTASTLTSSSAFTAFAVMVGQGIGAPPSTVVSIGSVGNYLRSGGAGTKPIWSTLTLPNTTTANQILYSSATSVVGQITTAATSALVTNSSSVPAFTSGSTANRVLRTDGTTVSFAQVAAATDISGTLPLVNGGTGTAAASANAAFNALSPMTTGGDIIYGGASGVATRLANGSATQVLTSNGTTTAPSWQTSPSAITNNYYSGYSSGATWSTTSGTFVDPTKSGTNALTQRTGSGITVTTAASDLPGITFTPATSGSVYSIKVSVNSVFNGVIGNDTALQLTDGTNVIDTATMQVAATLEGHSMTLQGPYVPGTGSAVTVKIQAAVSAGTGTIQNASGITGARLLEWSVIQIK